MPINENDRMLDDKAVRDTQTPAEYAREQEERMFGLLDKIDEEIMRLGRYYK